METKELNVLVGAYCREFREKYLDLKLTEFSLSVNESFQNIHAFEKGRANNIRYLFLYYKSANEPEQDIFTTGLFNIM